MPLSLKLDRKLRAAEESSDSEEYYEVTDQSSPSVIETGDGAEIFSSDEPDVDSAEDLSDRPEDGTVQAQMSRVSFGALARVHEQLSEQQSASRKRKRDEEDSNSQTAKLQALRERLQEIRAQKLAQGQRPDSAPKPQNKRQVAGQDNANEEDEHSDIDGSLSKSSGNCPHARSSKHAPAVRSSKRPVTRKRKVVEVKKPTFRDPRFDALSGPPPDENVLKNRYDFLDRYRASEMRELRELMKKTKSEADKEKFRKKLQSMESQQQTRQAKEKQQEILREHKKKEKELVKQGKKPFFLKKSEQKKLALIDRFQSMKSRQRDKVIERRRKRTATKERRNMPAERRGVQQAL